MPFESGTKSRTRNTHAPAAGSCRRGPYSSRGPRPRRRTWPSSPPRGPTSVGDRTPSRTRRRRPCIGRGRSRTRRSSSAPSRSSGRARGPAEATSTSHHRRPTGPTRGRRGPRGAPSRDARRTEEAAAAVLRACYLLMFKMVEVNKGREDEVDGTVDQMDGDGVGHEKNGHEKNERLRPWPSPE